ncbi:hypothetical protein GLOTRDRAFT_134625 [Gloeophyllum trabeum ATCC 11539]|uniref:Uncharacterized protein n=1 Tax=Gloeophyllum trabeum (strain ATCC 11539 / FP-39264 / Madison 617) TaxID=670483 RepID=S7PPH9_GLOTA|nr:uncharacterized protein GLOTRDRAFT_134625 [Gloeophyllum trabeum ATCC 11539]EPQ49776.1 hypothetical protein GLOTRDRAFT_134625 [Gloeophyllum trabeum ATCC 11539]
MPPLLKAKTVPAVFEHERLPPVLPVLLTDTNMFSTIQGRPPPVTEVDFLAQERPQEFAGGPVRTPKVTRHAPVPYRRSVTFAEEPRIRSGPSTSTDGQPLIAKPAGEVARLQRGGYNLNDALTGLGWSTKLIEEVSDFVKDKADAMLDTTQSLQSQNRAKVDKLKKVVMEQYSFLSRYEKCWPVHDMLKCHLKYTRTKKGSQKTRKGKGKAVETASNSQKSKLRSSRQTPSLSESEDEDVESEDSSE